MKRVTQISSASYTPRENHIECASQGYSHKCCVTQIRSASLRWHWTSTREATQLMRKGHRRQRRNPKRGITSRARSESRRITGKPYTYIIGSDESDKVKIGQTTHIAERLQALQTGSPVPLRLLRKISGLHHEAILHRNLKQFHSHGEWYEKTTELVDYINRYWRNDLDFQPIDHRPVERLD